MRILIGAVGVILLAACKPDAASEAAAAQGGRGSAAGSAAAGGQTSGGTRGGSNARGGGRGAATLTLALSDVSTVQLGTIEDVAAISGDLHPIETVAVRARIEGDLDAVNVREGDVVRTGQLLARFDADEQESALQSARADRVAAVSDLGNAQWNAEQSAQLFKAGAIAERDNKAAQQTVATMQARLAAAEARVRATASVVRDTRVLSPTSGIVDKRQVENGEHVARGAAMFSVVRNDVLELIAAMPARAAGTVRVGQQVRFVADGRAFAGTVARVSPTIDPVTRSVTVYVQIPNPSGTIRGGTFASGQVISRTLNNVIAIPRDAVHQAQGGASQHVYRIVNEAIDVAPVRTGTVDERAGLIEIVEGLEAGDRIVTGIVGNIGRGMRVAIAGTGEGGRSGRGRGPTGTP